jgi:hypothetical protein
VLDGQLQTGDDQHAVPPTRTLAFGVELLEVGGVRLRPHVLGGGAVDDVVRDREHFEPGAPIEVDELSRGEHAVAPGRVGVELGEHARIASAGPARVRGPRWWKSCTGLVKTRKRLLAAATVGPKHRPRQRGAVSGRATRRAAPRPPFVFRRSATFLDRRLLPPFQAVEGGPVAAGSRPNTANARMRSPMPVRSSAIPTTMPKIAICSAM